MNPLLNPSDLSKEAVPFDKIKTEHFLPAIDQALETARQNIEKIKTAKEENFENIILGLENSSDQLDYVTHIFYALFYAHCTDDLSGIAEKVNEKLTKFSSDVSLDQELFKRVKNVFEAKDKLNLDSASMKLLEEAYKDFTRNGSLLDQGDKE
jgi:peptidyl-dipeptidase Dcp